MGANGYSVVELSEKGPENIPDEYNTSKHLIYNSPAALAFNSPGAEGFGVKRAGLAVPGSIMLIVSPGCCGRNTSDITRIKGYEDRFFYLEIDNTDLVTARHLKKIPDAVKEIVDFCDEKPSLVMICITCVDALLGTDMERVAAKAEEKAGIPVRPCYMYALTREGRKPPMVQVRESLYSLLPKQKRKGTSVNLLGFFAPVNDSCELFTLLQQAGVKIVRQISTCENIEEFYRMGEANFNLVLNREAEAAADDLNKRLGMPYIELTRFYDPDRIEKQYRALAGTIGVSWDASFGKDAAFHSISELKKEFPEISFSIGEVINANPFELALTLINYGFEVKEIFANPDPDYFYYIDKIAEISPETVVYSNMEPTMIYYDIGDDFEKKDSYHVTLGKDAAYYHPSYYHVNWNSDEQPFGYDGCRKLFESIREAIV